MEQEHFEILLEKIDSNVELLVESLDGVNGRLDKAEVERRQLFDGQERIHLRLRVLETGQAELIESHGKLELRQEKLEQGQEKLEQGQEKLEQGQEKLEQGQSRLEQGLNEVRDELRGDRHAVGLLHAIATKHETRLQDVENTLRDHLDKH